MAMELDPETEARLRRLAEARHISSESLLRIALSQYLEREESAPGQHPSGRPWPRRTPVGGIITPV